VVELLGALDDKAMQQMHALLGRLRVHLLDRAAEEKR
jgi:hypothetical protein